MDGRIGGLQIVHGVVLQCPCSTLLYNKWSVKRDRIAKACCVKTANVQSTDLSAGTVDKPSGVVMNTTPSAHVIDWPLLVQSFAYRCPTATPTSSHLAWVHWLGPGNVRNFLTPQEEESIRQIPFENL